MAECTEKHARYITLEKRDEFAEDLAENEIAQ